MRPHHLLEVCLRLFALNFLVSVSFSIATLVEQWPGAFVPQLHVTTIGFGVIAPTIGYTLLLWLSPRLCRLLHDVDTDADRAAARSGRIRLLRIGAALLGLEYLAWSVHNAKWVALSLGGYDIDPAPHLVDGGIRLIVGMILVFAAHRIARAVDRWGGGPSPRPLIAQPRW